ncbi:MAG: RtcB family protein [Deltaproteobacteria bacterium]|nr:RtcB family protein [Deltaproteobacteria bacterium]
MNISLKQVDAYRWRIPKTGAMRVPGLLFSSSKLIRSVRNDPCLAQVANVATLPGIVHHSLAMPDIHWGYGFPIGGVAAFDLDEGIVSPGGVGYDINCGCRVMTTRLTADVIKPFINDLVQGLFRDIPCGVGSSGHIHLSKKEAEDVSVQGAAWAVKKGLGTIDDIEKTEDGGAIPGADPSTLSGRAMKRGKDQLGTLGSGNHFLEIQVVDRIYDSEKAAIFNLFEGQVTMFIHSGSRGFGHQICDDFLKEMTRHASTDGRYDALPDRQLIYSPLKSALAKRYLAAMACAANYAWANRQILMHWTRKSVMDTLSITPEEMGMRLLYDVCHNIAKHETHPMDGHETTLCVHRKGATRALPPWHPLLPRVYQRSGQPVLIPGDMGSYSYVLSGTEGAMEQSFGSCCHGAGRVLSRNQAVKKARGRDIRRELADHGVVVQSRGKRTLKEEMPEAYKSVSEVIESVHGAGLAKKVARLRPLGVVKG